MLSTIVTAGDKRFFWGIYLLVASIRMHKMKNPIKCLVKGLSEEEEQALKQYDVEVYRSEELDIPIQVQKPAALYLGAKESAYTTWIDADCIVEGDLSDLLIPAKPQEIMIRFRNRKENILRFRDLKTEGEIPDVVKKIWQEDVAEGTECKIETTSVNNVLTIHQSNLPLIERWDQQIRLIAKKDPARRAVAYTHSSGNGISDELVLNSLFAFSGIPYEIGSYQLDTQKGKRLLHLSLNPKPWEMWTVPQLKYYGLVSTILQWAKENGFKVPDLPWSLIPHLKPVAYLVAFAHEAVRRTAHALRLR